MTGISQKQFLGALAVYTAGGLFWAFLPIFIGLQISAGGMTQAEAGFLGSAYLIGFTLASLSAVVWLEKADWRFASSAAALAVIASLWIVKGADAYGVSAGAVSVIGFGMGVFWTLAYRVFAATLNPERSFGIGLVASYLGLAVTTYFIGVNIAPSYGLDGSAAVLSVLIFALGVGGLFLPKRAASGGEARAAGDTRLSSAVILGLSGLVASSLAFAGLWSFVERIGAAYGFESDAISPVISGNLIAIAAGSSLATAFGTRFGRAFPLIGGVVLLAACALTLAHAGAFAVYAAAVSGLGFFLGFIMPFQMGLVGATDPSGRFVTLITAAQGGGSAVGAYAGGVAFGAGGAGALALFAAVFFALAGASYFILIRKGVSA